MKKIISVVLALVMVLASFTFVSAAMTVEEIAKQYNEYETIVKNRGYGIDINASAAGNKLTIDIHSGNELDGNEKSYQFVYTLDGSILSAAFESEYAFTGMYYSQYLIDIIETNLGYDKGDYLLMLNSMGSTNDLRVETDGIEIRSEEDGYIFKIDISKKAKGIDLSALYVTVEDALEYELYIKQGSTQLGAGYVTIYVMNQSDNGEYLILVGEKGALGENAKKSVMSIIQVALDEYAANEFAEGFSGWQDGEAGDWTIEIDPELDPFYASFERDGFQIARIMNYSEEPDEPEEEEHGDEYWDGYWEGYFKGYDAAYEDAYESGYREAMDRIAKNELPFIDVEIDSNYYEAVSWAYRNDYTTGTDSIHFSPEKAITRGELITFLYRAAGCPEPGNAGLYKGEVNMPAAAAAAKAAGRDIAKACPFKDIREGSWAYDAVVWAWSVGITKGVSAEKFGQAQTCTTGMAIDFMTRFMGAESDAWRESTEDCSRGATVLIMYSLFDVLSRIQE